MGQSVTNFDEPPTELRLCPNAPRRVDQIKHLNQFNFNMNSHL
jgi:23S rRNA A1618 N6-methylase RlmF